MGISGAVKSAYLSQRHTGRPDSFLFSKHVITEVDDAASFDIRGRLAVGIDNFGASHPDLRRSKFSVTDTGTVRVDAPRRVARIGPCSVVHVEGDFSIGDSYVNSHARILCGEEITIGDGCALAWNVQLLDDDRHALSISDETRQQS